MVSYEKFLELFQPIIDWNEKYEKEADLLSKLYPSSFIVPEGDRLIERYIDLLSVYVGDSDWISYYVWECELGRNPMEVSWNDNTKRIKLNSIKKLYKLIVEGNNHG